MTDRWRTGVGRGSAVGAGLALLLAASPAEAQGVTEEVEAGGVFIPDAPPEGGEDPRGGEEGAVPEETGPAVEPEAAPPGAPAPLPHPSTPPERASGATSRFVLDNGLEVILEPIEGRRFVAVALAYGVGRRDEPEGYPGLARLARRALMAGTDEINEAELPMRLEAAGAVRYGATLDEDRTVLFETLPAAQLEWALWLEGQRMARAVAGVSDARLARLRAAVVDELALDARRREARAAIAARAYPEGHPYRHPAADGGDVRAVRARHLQWFLQRWVRPERATLALVGGFDPARARELVRRHLGPVRSHGEPPPLPEAPAPAPRSRAARIARSSPDPSVTVAWPTPAALGDAHLALEIFAAYLDARLRSALLDAGLARRVSATQEDGTLGSLFVVRATPAPGGDADALVEAIDGVLAEARGALADAARGPGHARQTDGAGGDARQT
ncbi:MAG TPA: insulinase family protein, partial [Sandaracinaceae bacterium LLY-WYZ-13_1]|nr:insulinase family protein [Sandaracinaceae bacterium LLY-WYZ-13_1]